MVPDEYGYRVLTDLSTNGYGEEPHCRKNHPLMQSLRKLMNCNSCFNFKLSKCNDIIH